MKLLSVVVPVYNGSEYLEETVRMILESEYVDLEVIVVDDGSSDGSAEIVKKIQEKDRRVVLYEKENGGVVSSRNYGLDKASGEYVCFADQDDFVKPFMYARLISAIERDDSDMGICSSGRSVNGEESIYEAQADGLWENEDVRKRLLYPLIFNSFDVPIEYDRGNRYPHIWNCVFKKSFLMNNGIRFRAYVNYEDDLLVKTETLAKAGRVSTISDIGYLWRVNLKSETYARHFVEDIGKKHDLQYRDMVESLRACDSSDETIEAFRCTRFCRQYLEAVYLLSSPTIKKSRRFIKEYFEENIYSRDFEEAIQWRKYVKNGQVQLKTVLPFLAKKRSVLCYRAEKMLIWILELSLHSKALTRLERKTKK